MLDIQAAALQAEKQIRHYVRYTPLDFSTALSRKLGAQVYLKCENLQYTGSFKVRGAFNFLLSLTAAQKQQGVTVASTGNHGAAMGLALSQLKIPGIIFVPKNTASTKIDNIHNYNVPLEFYGDDMLQTEMHAINYAKQHNSVYVSPYNSEYVVAGQATIGLEITQQLKKIDAVLVAVGGGGLIAGIAGYIKSVSPQTQVIGCLPENSPVMAESVKIGKMLEMPTLPTLSDATAGGIEPDAITFPLCQKWVDDWCLVSEEEIKQAIITLIKTQHLLIEGASGVALAALLKNANQFQGKNIVIVLSGANISLEILQKVLG